MKNEKIKLPGTESEGDQNCVTQVERKWISKELASPTDPSSSTVVLLICCSKAAWSGWHNTVTPNYHQASR